jgi:hypothetical protein
MRVTPTSFELGNLELSDYVGTAYAFTTPSIFGTISSPYITMMYFQGLTGVTANRLMYLRNANNANGYLGLSAEL